MTGKELEVIDIGNAVIDFNLPEAVIAEKREAYKDLVIKDINDKVGFDLVHKARIDIKTLRVAVKKRGEFLRAKSNEWNKNVIATEKKLIGQLEMIEDRLADEENRVEAEKARIKREEEERRVAFIKARASKFFQMGCTTDGESYFYSGVAVANGETVRNATDEHFDALISALQKIIDEEKAEAALAEAERLRREAEIKEKEEEQRKKDEAQEAEKKRLVEEQARLEKERADFEAEKQKARDEEAAKKRAAEDKKKAEEDEKKRQAELEQAKKDAAAKAIKDAEEKAAREAEEKKAREEKARIAAERKAARQPDKKKIAAYLQVIGNILPPEMKTDEGKAVMASFNDGLGVLFDETQKQLKEM